MIELVVALCAMSIGIWLFQITRKLDSIAESLRKIAEARSTEIGITVPGNKTVRVDLPSGGEITQVVKKEAHNEP